MMSLNSVYLDKQKQILELEAIIGHCKKQYKEMDNKDPLFLATWRACLADIMEIERREEARRKYQEERKRMLEKEQDKTVLQDLIEGIGG